MKPARICLISLLLIIPGVVICADLETLSIECEGCHGSMGQSTDSDIPIIAGQSEAFITSTLKSFKERGRPCLKSTYRHGDTSRPETSMCTVTSTLSEEDMEALARHFSELDFVPANQAFDPGMVAAGEQLYTKHCQSCHSKGDNVAARGPILAGQWTPYLIRGFQQALTGEHLVPPYMERTLAGFSDEEKAAVLNFLASQQD
jgi:sulfide dehydrogenase cytochrome subunit